jgi:hypothetical protein
MTIFMRSGRRFSGAARIAASRAACSRPIFRAAVRWLMKVRRWIVVSKLEPFRLYGSGFDVRLRIRLYSSTSRAASSFFPCFL